MASLNAPRTVLRSTNASYHQLCSHARLPRPTLTATTAAPFVIGRDHSRNASSSAGYYAPPDQPEKKGVKIGHVFGVLALVGIGATSYGLYNFYSTFTAYPAPIRTHLRSALRSAATESYSRADSSFAQAYQLALNDPSLGSSRQDRLIRTTGIAIRWGGMWEKAGQLDKAIEAYDKAFQEVAQIVDAALPLELGASSSMSSSSSSSTSPASKTEIMRGAAIALKVGDLWSDLGGADALGHAEERYAWALQEMMRINMTPEQLQKVEIEQRHGVADQGAVPPPRESENDLPEWATKVEMVGAMERLGGLYARLGKIEYAQPLLQQAIFSLLPPPSKEGPRGPRPPIPNQCHAATLMNNLSSALVQEPSPSASSIDAASRWARQSLTVANGVRKEMQKQRGGKEVPLNEREEAECELVALVGAYNLGKLAELSKDKSSARAWFEKSRSQAVRIGSRDGLEQSLEAMRRL